MKAHLKVVEYMDSQAPGAIVSRAELQEVLGLPSSTLDRVIAQVKELPGLAFEVLTDREGRSFKTSFRKSEVVNCVEPTKSEVVNVVEDTEPAPVVPKPVPSRHFVSPFDLSAAEQAAWAKHDGNQLQHIETQNQILRNIYPGFAPSLSQEEVTLRARRLSGTDFRTALIISLGQMVGDEHMRARGLLPA